MINCGFLHKIANYYPQLKRIWIQNTGVRGRSPICTNFRIAASPWGGEESILKPQLRGARHAKNPSS